MYREFEFELVRDTKSFAPTYRDVSYGAAGFQGLGMTGKPDCYYRGNVRDDLNSFASFSNCHGRTQGHFFASDSAGIVHVEDLTHVTGEDAFALRQSYSHVVYHRKDLRHSSKAIGPMDVLQHKQYLERQIRNTATRQLKVI